MLAQVNVLDAQRLEAAQRRKAGPEEIFILETKKKQADVAVRQAEAERDVNEELARRAILLDRISGQRAILANDTKEEQKGKTRTRRRRNEEWMETYMLDDTTERKPATIRKADDQGGRPADRAEIEAATSDNIQKSA